MRSSRAAVSVSFALVALVAACSQSGDDPLNPQPLPPEEEGARGPAPGQNGGTSSDFSGSCNSQNLPKPGAACDAKTDTTCSWAVTCPTGLVLPYEVTCTNGTWQVSNDCPEEGKNDERGCPARQPENGTSCDLTQGNAQCGYILECTGYRKTATATCSGNAWSTTPLGVCD